MSKSKKIGGKILKLRDFTADELVIISDLIEDRKDVLDELQKLVEKKIE